MECLELDTSAWNRLTDDEAMTARVAEASRRGHLEVMASSMARSELEDTKSEARRAKLLATMAAVGYKPGGGADAFFGRSFFGSDAFSDGSGIASLNTAQVAAGAKASKDHTLDSAIGRAAMSRAATFVTNDGAQGIAHAEAGGTVVMWHDLPAWLDAHGL